MDKRPGIILTSQDLERLEKLPAASFPGKAELSVELDRADVVEPQDVPPDVVTMNSKVCFALESGGGVIKVRIVEVVYQPERAGELHR